MRHLDVDGFGAVSRIGLGTCIDLRPDEQAALTAAARAFRPVSVVRTLADRVRERLPF